MSKPKYVRATLILKPKKAAAARKGKSETSTRGPWIGTLVLENWRKNPSTKLEVKLSVKPAK
jgi:hypothetical protein